VSDWLETLAGDKAAPFELTGGPSTAARIRPLAVRRAVRNLVENATRYGDGATVGWHRAGDDLVIEVTDHGPGIPEEELEEVFAPFHRLETSRSLETGGHGLGLAIARAIVRGHGGDIRLENRAEGGLKASILIPLAEDAPINNRKQRKET